MRNRQANGLSKSGRYKAEDTARLKYIHCTGFPLIQKGLLPLPHDIHMLELGALETLRGQDKVNLDQWVRKSISWLMCALGQICFQTDLSFLLPCVNGHAPAQL